MKILVVDVSKAMRRIVIRTCRKTGIKGIEFFEAETGHQALALVKDHEFDLIISEWNISQEMSGLELLTRLNNLGSSVSFGFLVASEVSPEMVEQAAEAGAMFLLSKQIPLDEMSQLIKDFI